MMTLKLTEIIEAVGGKLLCGSSDTVIDNVTTSSLEAKEGSLFVPLIGEKNDAHKFIGGAFENGCSAVIAHKDIELPKEGCVIRVEDTLKALGDIAALYKQKYRIPTISVTGSVGKTTTKDILAAALGAGYNTVKTQRNYNNEIGVPWTIFSQTKEHEMAVVEMGMNHFGEIEKLVRMAKPDAAVITNIGMAHIENLGSQEGILKAKMEITKYFTDENTLIVNGDDKLLATIRDTNPVYKTIYYGIENPENDVYARDIKNKGLDGVEFTAVMGNTEYKVYVAQPGVHNVYNALAALCAAKVFGVPIEKAVKGIAECEYTSGRLEVLHKDGVEIIRDCYNASPDAIRAALKVMSHTMQKRKVAVLGDVLEMGDFAKQAHTELGDSVKESGADVLITGGENAAYIAQRAKELGVETYSFKTTEEAAEFTKDYVRDGDCVLVKASHGMHFEKIIDAIMNK